MIVAKEGHRGSHPHRDQSRQNARLKIFTGKEQGDGVDGHSEQDKKTRNKTRGFSAIGGNQLVKCFGHEGKPGLKLNLGDLAL